MNFIRHLLSHLLLFTILLALVLVYFYRHQILPEQHANKIDDYAKLIHPKLAAVGPGNETQVSAVEEEFIPQNQNIDVIYVDDVPLVNGSLTTEEKPAAVETEVAIEKEQQEVVVAEVVKTETSNDEAVAEKMASVQPAEPEVKAEEMPESSLAKVTQQQIEEPAEPASTDKAAADYLTLLRDARTAYGKGNMELAIKKYNELIELENDEADFYGELGNVYYAMGKWDQAGASYYEAAVRLIENKQMAQVGYLQRVLQGLDSERAEKLAKQIANR